MPKVTFSTKETLKKIYRLNIRKTRGLENSTLKFWNHPNGPQYYGNHLQLQTLRVLQAYPR